MCFATSVTSVSTSTCHAPIHSALAKSENCQSWISWCHSARRTSAQSKPMKIASINGLWSSHATCSQKDTHRMWKVRSSLYFSVNASDNRESLNMGKWLSSDCVVISGWDGAKRIASALVAGFCERVFVFPENWMWCTWRRIQVSFVESSQAKIIRGESYQVKIDRVFVRSFCPFVSFRR